MADLLQRIEEGILNRQLLRRGQKVLVAVSGGLDSMSLLELLQSLATRHKWRLTVAHFNHQLRGRSSDADEQLVRKTAAALRLPLITGRAEVGKFAKTSKLSIEMAARKLRHEFYVHSARERKISTIALAHHADDQVELFFLRVLRGSGGEGLAGMKWSSASPVNKEITLVRPLLGVTKNELRTFAQENQITFREDSTNARLDRPRNRVRNELLPLLRRHYQPALTRMILRLMKIVGADSEVVGKVARGWLKTGRADLLVGQEARQRIATVFSYDELPVAVQRRVLQRQLKELGVWADFELVERLRCEPETLFGVSTGISVTRDVAGMISLRTPTTAGFKVNELTFELIGGAGEVDFEGIGIQWNIENAKAAITLGRTAGCESFDAAKVGGQITLRHWRAGDRFQPIGLKSAAKLQDLFTNQKIPRARRHNLVVAEAANGEIFWVQNLRMSEPFKLTPATKRRLVWRWRCGSA